MMPVDPITAIANMITALATAYVETLKATPPENQKTISDWYVKDTAAIRAFFKIGVSASS
jgi:hypothetical protein